MAVSKNINFMKALPVWEKNKNKEKNRTLAFRCVVANNSTYILRIAGQNVFRILINGYFFASGPARAAHGFYRVSEYEITKHHLNEKNNIITVLVCGYNIASYQYTNDSPFLCAEITDGNKVLFATGYNFECINFEQKIQKVQRYSFQRSFTEQYKYDFYYDSFFLNPEKKFNHIELEVQNNKKFIERGVPYCEYNGISPVKILNMGNVIPSMNPKICEDRSLKNIDDKIQGFKEEDINGGIVNEWYSYMTEITSKNEMDYKSIQLNPNGSVVYDMGKNTTGYIRLSVYAEHDCIVYAVFDEYIEGSTPDGGRNGTANIVKWLFTGGRNYDVITIEPYTFRYIQIVSINGSVVITNISQIRETYKESAITNIKKMPTENLQKIYDAAVETFMQNATDILMDCPSRERAGWLCDSFFTARTEYSLTGQSLVERNFLENYILAEKFENIPNGMIPMCYPGDHTDGIYIHNWALWFVIELKEYLFRTGDRELIDKAKKRVYKLLEFTRLFENKDGFLSNLQSWVFVEWSSANDFVQDINYPTNMIYAMFMESIGIIYDDINLIHEADTLRKKINEVAFDGEFYHDNSVYNEEGKPILTDNKSETCQYYAFFTKTATKESHHDLFDKLVNKFGPDRNKTNAFGEIYESNAFVGNYLRLDILLNNGYKEKVIKEIEEFFFPMAEKTSTLWENMTDYASCNHGFASFVVVLLNNIYNDKNCI